ncbi:Ubp16p [Sugiyamaella lignohabitans]|uniref:Ubiquitin carboxyl-terminal hydrolase n=1 Tax=Sugiyamaella lignohabitans TaxID=796027 RepID=A0A167EYM4_9ASCO|nr:Ubp16p [Sugiyamaella lignohabitans]ANB14613.1 Ubp16p [Sugiyamaella lignohabitans]
MNVLRRKKKSGKYTVGLTNRANDCFANSNIQALAAVPGLVDYLLQLNAAAIALSNPDAVRMSVPGTSVPGNTTAEKRKLASSTEKSLPQTPDSQPAVAIADSPAAGGTATPASSAKTNTNNSGATTDIPTRPTTPSAQIATAVTPKSPSGGYGASMPASNAQTLTPLLSNALLRIIKELNEPILVPKTLSPWTFLGVLEKIYKSRISRNQHDAHELLHLILETLENEYDKIVKESRSRTEKQSIWGNIAASHPSPLEDAELESEQEAPKSFAFSGSTIDRITCSRCGYSPPATPSAFLVLSLMVPQKKSAQLTDLLDGLSSPEYIQDYGCQLCRLKHASMMKNGDQFKQYLSDPSKLPSELEDKLPKNIVSPIAKSTRFHRLPDVLAIHLSRSIYGGFGASRNSCKVSTKEFIELTENETGNIIRYKLMAMIRHKGTHQMGHYECFRRKNLDTWRDILQMLDEDEKDREIKKGLRLHKQQTPSVSSFQGSGTGTGTAQSATPTPRQLATTASTAGTISANSSPRLDLATGAINGNYGGTAAVPTATATPVASSPTIASMNSSNSSSGASSSITTKSSATEITNYTMSTTPSSPLTTITTPSSSIPETAFSSSATTGDSQSPAPSLASDNVTLSSASSSISGVSAASAPLRLTADTPSSPALSPPPSAIPLPYPADRSMPSPASVSISEFASAEISLDAIRAVPLSAATLNGTKRPVFTAPTTPTRSPTPTLLSVQQNVSPPSHHEWWKVSDDKVWECTTKEVLREESGAYLLFYERLT